MAPGNGSLMNLNDGYMHVAGIGGIPSDMGWSIDMKKQFASSHRCDLPARRQDSHSRRLRTQL